MSSNLKHYLVTGKGDDYGACLTEVVCTTKANAKEYYSHTEIEPQDVDVLLKYFDLVDYPEEVERTDEQRYYGNGE